MNVKDIKIYILANELLDQRTKETVKDLAKLFKCSLHTVKKYRAELGVQKKDTPPIRFKRFEESPAAQKQRTAKVRKAAAAFKALKTRLLSAAWVPSHE